MNKVLVLGSLNMDQVISVDHLPEYGQTIYGNTISYSCGGKGANQAVALAKMNLATYMMGKVGNDSYGIQLIESLNKYKVNTQMVLKANSPTGMASIYVDKKGGNNIVIVKGANFDNSIKDIEDNIEFIKGFDAIVCQFEIPQETILKAFKIAKENNITTFLNPAPAVIFDKQILKYTDFIVPNETEFKELFNVDKDINQITKDDLKLLNPNCHLIVTYGSTGVYYWDNNKFTLFKSNKVNTIDTTAAGDSFIGGFVANYLKSKNISESIQFGINVSSITVTKKGAQDSIPTYEEVIKKYY